jgi:hypothetical protein
LIEVLLAIGLSTVLLALLALAINMFLVRVDASRSTVEEAQLARGVLRMIAEDLRNSAVVYTQDITSAQAASSSQAFFDVGEADATPTPSEETSENVRPYVGVFGDTASLQADVLRVRPVYSVSLEDPEQSLVMTIDSPGITSVRYLFSDAGLVRQQAGRDASLREAQQGLSDSWEASSRVVASEVADLRFRYHDGDQALDQWDLDETQGVSPLAVEVRIGMRSQAASPTTEAEGDEAVQDMNAPLRYYRLTIPLTVPPGAAAAEAGEEAPGAGLP